MLKKIYGYQITTLIWIVTHSRATNWTHPCTVHKG
jgi:hypothetical protein